MIASVGFTLSALVFTLLIAIIYFSKKKYVEVEHKLYGFLLLWTIFLLLLELYCVFTMRYRNLHPILNEFLCRIYVLGATTWIITVVIYALIIDRPDKFKNISDIFKDSINSSAIAFGSVAFIISCFLPLSYTSGKNNELYVIGGTAIVTLYALSVFVGAYLFFVLIRNKNKSSLFKRLPVIFFIVAYLIMFVIQHFYTDFNDLTFIFGLVVVAMYFTIVSQDYKLATDLEEATKLAEQANKEKTEFLSKMSHEIRTPMNAIMGFSESLLADKDNLSKEKIDDDAKNIYLAGNNLVSTINNILDLTKIESGNVKLNEDKYFIGDIIYDIQDYVEARIDKTRVNFIINFDENIPKGLYGDKQKIYKVLLNIISNSIRYTTSGEIKLSVGCFINKGTAKVKFLINDSGIGIKEEDFDKVFVKFAKMETDTKDIERGAGLGLSIAKALIDMMGGNITFTSDYNVGTQFVVEIHNKVVDYHKCGDIIARKSVLKAIEPKLNCSGKKILVVDDNKLNLKVLYNLLKEYNFDVSLVESGYSCINIIKRKEQFDLILIDHLMPDLNGIETFKNLKDLKVDLPPIIMTTANATVELINEFKDIGLDGYLSKPIDRERLEGLIKYYFKK